MNVTITIPDAVAPRVLDSFAEALGYPGLPQTKAQFVKEQIKAYIMDVVRRHESQQAGEVARQAKLAEVDGAIVIT